MTLEEALLQTHDKLVLSERLPIPASDEEMASEIAPLFKKFTSFTYREAIEEGLESAFLKLLFETARTYGEAKWNEGIEAARDSMCSDSPEPPKFIP